MAFGSGRDVEYDPKNPHRRVAPVRDSTPMSTPKRAHTPKSSGRGSSSSSSAHRYLRQQQARRAAREAEDWRANDDRNDDPVYHRSFDDGSMHLVSSQFRDGKPVDNHGKDLGGYGSAAPTRYRSHALQAPTVTGETTTFVPLGETNNTLRYFAATETKVHERGWSGLRGAPPWDATPYIKIPYTLRGLRIKSNEPWVDQVGSNPEIDFATSSLSRLDDGQRDTPVRREEGTPWARPNRRQPAHTHWLAPPPWARHPNCLVQYPSQAAFTVSFASLHRLVRISSPPSSLSLLSLARRMACNGTGGALQPPQGGERIHRRQPRPDPMAYLAQALGLPPELELWRPAALEQRQRRIQP